MPKKAVGLKTLPMPKMEGADACMLMHTALRKLCDSHITSALYNFIHMLEVKPAELDPWRIYGQLVADRITAGSRPDHAVTDAMEKFEDKMEEARKTWRDSGTAGRREIPSEIHHSFYTLFCIFRCFEKSDWAAMSGFLLEENEDGPDA